MFVWLQLCSAQGVALFSFVRVPLRSPLLFTSDGVSLTRAERLNVLGCGMKSELVRLLSLRLGRHFALQTRRFARQQLAHGMVRHVVARLAVTIRSGMAKEAEDLCASGQCAAAVEALQSAIHLGLLPSRAMAAWLHIHGREGIAQDHRRAFELVEEGTRAGCHHCQGMLALCYWGGYGCAKNSAQCLMLAKESCSKGSRYGQFVMGWLLRLRQGGPAYDNVQAAKFYALAAEQNFDGAQHALADMYLGGMGVTGLQRCGCVDAPPSKGTLLPCTQLPVATSEARKLLQTRM